MKEDIVRCSMLLVAACCGVGAPALADPSPVTPPGLPPQIIPSAPEVGLAILQMPGSGNQAGNGGTGTGGSGGGANYAGSGSAYDTLMSEPYGNAAASGAQQAGINVNTLADFAQVESGFRNIPTANGSTTATGVWQIEQGTWNDYVTKYNLPYGPSDINNSTAQAAVASYIIKDYANTVSQATGQPATTLQTYGAYVFGPTAGAEIAGADPSTPLSQFVSPQALSNNSMQGWTVGQFYSVMGNKIGATAGEKVTA